MQDVITLKLGAIYTEVLYSENFPSYVKNQVNRLLGSVMQARPEGFQFSPRYRNHQWDGYIKLFSRNKFPTGLLELARKVLENYAEEYEYKVTINFNEYRGLQKIAFPPIILEGYKLRDYQDEAVQVLINRKRGVAWMATNSGKTLIMAAICKLLCEEGINIFILTHKKELLYQTAKVIEDATGIEVGIVGDGHDDYFKAVTVGMIQSVSKDVDTPTFAGFANNVGCLLIDECHHTSSKTMTDVVMRIPALYRFGFSGTPLKNDVLADMQLQAVTGSVLFRVSNEKLIAEGYSAKPEIRVYKLHNTTLSKDETYQDAYNALIVNNNVRNELVVSKAYAAYKSGRVVLILVDRIEHQNVICNSYAKLYGDSTITALNGSHSTDYRKEHIDNMRSGEPHVYISTEVLGEGVDIPALDVVILANGGKSYVKLMQHVGRGMRKKDGDNKVIILDFYDTGSHYLEAHSKERLKAYESEGFPVRIVDRDLANARS